MTTGNPIIPGIYTADPTALVYHDTVYLFTGHDEAPVGTEEYVMNNWLCFSSTDMMHWTAHGSPFAAKDFKWASGNANASKIIEQASKFYFYAAETHAAIPGRAIGVFVSNHPTMGYEDVKGAAVITHNMLICYQ